LGSKGKIIVTVTNDLTHDQRVRKVCASLVDLGYTPLLVGRKRKDSSAVKRAYPTKRLKLLFNKGPLFYAEFNLRLFFFLLLNRCAVIHANDLDTLLAGYLASKLKGVSLVYDTHEYFTEVPELQSNLTAKRVWETIEAWIFPRLKYLLTVNESIATLYKEKYGISLRVMRNIPNSDQPFSNVKTRNELGLPLNKKILIIQGTGINVDRGNEEILEAMTFLDEFYLLIVGSGDVLPKLKEQATDLGLSERIRFIDKLPYEQLIAYTSAADAGLSLDKNTNINYKYSLPNKLFDFIKAGIPCVVSDLPEVGKIVREYQVGLILSSFKAEQIAAEIEQFFIGESPKIRLADNLKQASSELTWEKEAQSLIDIYSEIKGSDG